MKEQDTNSNLYKIRHSLAHILAQAVLEIRPKAKQEEIGKAIFWG